MLTLNIFHTFPNVSIVDFEQVNVTWVNIVTLISKNKIISLEIFVKLNQEKLLDTP